MNGFENFNSVEQDNSHEKLKMSLDLQVALIQASVPAGADLDEYPLEWIDRNHKIFRQVFEDLDREDSNLLEEWKENPDRVVEVIRERMSMLSPGEQRQAA